MTVICFIKVNDLALASHRFKAFHQEEGNASTLQKREIASRPLFEGSLHGAVYVVGPNERVCRLCGSFI